MITVRDVSPVDPILTNLSLDVKFPNVIGREIFKTISVGLVSGTYFKYDKGNKFRIPETRRAISSDYGRIDWNYTSDTYACIDNGLEGVIDDKIRPVTPAALQLESDLTELLTKKMLLASEKRITDIVTSTTYITNNTTVTGSAQWNNYNTSNPITTIDAGRKIISDAIGARPNTIVFGSEVWDKFKWHPALTAVLHAERGVVTEDIAKYILGFQNLYVGETLYNAAEVGQTASLARLWGKDVLLAYVEPRPGLQTISLGFNFEFEARKVLPKFRNSGNIGDVIRTTEWNVEKLVSADCGYLIKNAVA